MAGSKKNPRRSLVLRRRRSLKGICCCSNSAIRFVSPLGRDFLPKTLSLAWREVVWILRVAANRRRRWSRLRRDRRLLLGARNRGGARGRRESRSARGLFVRRGLRGRPAFSSRRRDARLDLRFA